MRFLPGWKFVHFFGILLIMVTVAGCNGVGSADVEMTVYTSETYEMTITFSIPTEYLSMVGGTSEIENRLDEMVQQAADDGEKVTWERDKKAQAGEVGYIIKASGKGFDNVDTGFTIQPTVYDGKDALEFNGDFSDFATFGDFSFALHGKEILETNGTEFEKGMVRWYNAYQPAHAIFTPKEHINWTQVGAGLIVGLVCLGTLLAAGVTIFLLVRQNRQ